VKEIDGPGLGSPVRGWARFGELVAGGWLRAAVAGRPEVTGSRTSEGAPAHSGPSGVAGAAIDRKGLLVAGRQNSGTRVLPINKGRTADRDDAADPVTVRGQVGIDAAVVATHHAGVREYRPDGAGARDPLPRPADAGWFAPTGQALAPYPGVLVVAEPTSMTWLGLSIALREGGLDLSLVGARHAARLRGAIIDSSLLQRAA